MNSILRLGMALMAGIMFFATSQASARVVNYSGECSPNGGNWTIVITIDDNTGEVTRREGITCHGTHWVDHCTVSAGSLGPTSTYYITETSATPRWWVRFNMDQSGNITEMWGKNADGINWVASGDNNSLE